MSATPKDRAPEKDATPPQRQDGDHASQETRSEARADELRIVIITGLSGAGRSTALNALEDLGFFCVDNLPAPLVDPLIDTIGAAGMREIGLGIDVRSGGFLDAAASSIDALKGRGINTEVIFLDCADEELLKRFSETRRPHRLAEGGDILEAVRLERKRLGDLRARADTIFDTTSFSVHELRKALVEHLTRRDEGWRMITRVLSFGFKYGLPAEANLVFDVRYLPNPHFIRELRPKTGRDPEVSEYVLGSPEGAALIDQIEALLRTALPGYESEGKAYLTIAIGCTGGKHRSVAIAEELGARLSDLVQLTISHRDVARAKGRESADPKLPLSSSKKPAQKRSDKHSENPTEKP